MKIHETLKFKSGDALHPHVLYEYGSDPIYIDGRVQFDVIGDVKFNSVKLANTRHTMDMHHKAKITIGKESGIIFQQLPKFKPEIPEYVPVEDVPETPQTPEEQLNAYIEAYLRSKGIIQSEDITDRAEQLQTYDEEDDDDDFFMPIDTESLVLEDTETTTPIPETQYRQDELSDGDIQPSAELQPEDTNPLAEETEQTARLRSDESISIEKSEPEPTQKTGESE